MNTPGSLWTSVSTCLRSGSSAAPLRIDLEREGDVPILDPQSLHHAETDDVLPAVRIGDAAKRVEELLFSH